MNSARSSAHLKGLGALLKGLLAAGSKQPTGYVFDESLLYKPLSVPLNVCLLERVS
jgi:hypothetical protein